MVRKCLDLSLVRGYQKVGVLRSINVSVIWFVGLYIGEGEEL